MSTKKIKKIKKMQAEQQLHCWAHKGNLESIKNLQKFTAKEKNQYLLGQAECALEETSFYYYSPEDDNQQEEKDFLLKKIILNLEKEIKTIKYKNIPLKILESIHLDQEDKIIDKKIKELINNLL